MTGMRRARALAAAALLVALAGAALATARIDHEPPRPAGVGVEYSHVGRVRLRAAYLEAIATGPVRRRGEVRCARGAPDERAWSRPAHPSRIAGRFACRVENGRAAMWWTDTDRGVLAHAVAPDDDVARLFAWWLSHSER